MKKLLIFAGTTEGRVLAERLLRSRPAPGAADIGGPLEITACVATEYGKNVLEEGLEGLTGREREQLHILCGRLSPEEMAGLMEREGFAAAVDATHPYAAAVTACIRRACAETETLYIRLLREEGETLSGCRPVYVESSPAAARYLSGTEGPVLLTTGSKELEAFTEIEGYEQRLFARILPMEEAVRKCTELGFSGRQLICMQGPFSYEMNAALLKQTEARYLVTKDSGRTGGFEEKLKAAADLGVQPVIIGRSPEIGEGLEEVLLRLGDLFGLCFPEERKLLRTSFSKDGEFERAEDTAADRWERPVGSAKRSSGLSEKIHLKNQESGKSDWFPLFINLMDRTVVVVGAGRIAARRIRTLLQFSCRLTVVAPEAAPEVRREAERGGLRLVERAYETADLADGETGRPVDFVLAATNSRECNRRIYLDCKQRGIPVNIADRREESDFYFPGIARSGAVVAGVTAGGADHALAKEASRRVRQALKELEEDTVK